VSVRSWPCAFTAQTAPRNSAPGRAEFAALALICRCAIGPVDSIKDTRRQGADQHRNCHYLLHIHSPARRRSDPGRTQTTLSLYNAIDILKRLSDDAGADIPWRAWARVPRQTDPGYAPMIGAGDGWRLRGQLTGSRGAAHLWPAVGNGGMLLCIVYRYSELMHSDLFRNNVCLEYETC